jgi:long-chain fatty acid transport protein
MGTEGGARTRGRGTRRSGSGRGRRLGLACAACFALCSIGHTPSVQASPQEVLGFGYRATALGQTGAADARGIDAVYANPALLSREHQLSLQLGIAGAFFDLEANGLVGAPLTNYPGYAGNTIGGVIPLPFGGVLEDRVTVGVGFVTPFDVVVRGRILYPEKPQFLFADRVQSVGLNAGLGIDIGHGIRLGGGFMALAALEGSVLVGTDASGRIGTVVEDTLVASYAPLIGASYDIGDDYRIGVGVRGELQARFNVVIVAEDLGQIEIPPINISGVAQYDPWQVSLELARHSGDWRVAIGATYKHWSAYPGPLEATVRCEDAPDPDASCNAPIPIDVDYSPVVAPRAGVERPIGLAPGVELALRGGYSFEPSPAPEQRGRSNYFDNHRSVFSVGYGVAFDDPLPSFGFDGFAQLQLLHPRDHEKRVAEGALYDGVVATGGFVFSGGASATVKF